MRNVLASELPYGDVALPAVIAAVQQGLELTIVHGGVASVADQVWITRKDDERIKTVQDLAGKKLGYSSPKSVTDMITSMMLDANGLTGKVERKSIGGVGSGLTALREGAVDMTYVTAAGLGAREEQFPPGVQLDRMGAARDADRRRGQDRIPEEEPGRDPRHHRGAAQGRRVHQVEPGRIRDDHGEGIQDQPKPRRRPRSRTCRSASGVYWSPGEFDYEGMDHDAQGPAAGEGGRARPVRLVEDRRRELSCRRTSQRGKPKS